MVDDWDALYSNAPFAMGVLDADLRFVRVNKRLARMNNYPVHAHIGRRIDELFTETNIGLMPSLGSLLDGATFSIQLVVEPVAGHGKANADCQRIHLRAARGPAGELRFISVIVCEGPPQDLNAPIDHGTDAFAGLLSKLSSEFANIPSDCVNAKIEGGMAQLVQFMGVQRSTLVEVDAQGQLRITHCHAEPGFTVVPPGSVSDSLPWFAEMLHGGQIICLSDVDELPLGALQERIVSKTDRIKANITIPFSVGGMPLCALAIGSTRSRQWTTEDISRLKLAGEVLANALARKRTEENLQRTRENLAHMARVSTVGQLATSITHEINQPLCAMVSNAEAAIRYLATDHPDVAEVNAALSDIVYDGRRAGEVITRTYAMLKRHSVKFDLLDINRLIEGIRPVVANYALIRRIPLQLNVDPAMPRVYGHAVQIQQVVINLLVNAIDAVSAESTRTGAVTLNAALDVDARKVVIVVTDNGIGLAASTVELIFEPFYTTKSNGLGMGLSIARTIVSAHGGRLWAENNPDRGAKFSFSLPVPKESLP